MKAVLIGIQLPRVSDVEAEGSLAELSRLVTTLGYEVVGQMCQRRSSDRNATVLGEGKLKQLAQWTGGTGNIGPIVPRKKHKAALRFEEENDIEEDTDDEHDEMTDEEAHSYDDAGDNDIGEMSVEAGTHDFVTGLPHKADHSILEKEPTGKVDIVIFDCDLSPSQLRNVEGATGVTVLDRTGVIIEIFSRHARSRAARLQVEIARLTYVAPRLRETGGGEDRQGGGIGGKGAGETSLELDRRKIRDRIKELKEELISIAHEQDNRRARRVQEITVALVGYTNAGKSSLMRALTGSEVLVADKLFATLDTTVRLLYPESRPKILVSDTVGFIKKLPHDLVASFKSTLDEALNASLLLYTVDASDPTFRSQMEVTKAVLAEVGATEIKSLLLLNKVDKLKPEEIQVLKTEFPDAILLSSKNPQDVANLRIRLIEEFETGMVDQELMIPYTTSGAIGEIREKMRVLDERYDERGLTLKVRSHAEHIDRIRARFKL
jgi:GTP-binding protein HflX